MQDCSAGSHLLLFHIWNEELKNYWCGSKDADASVQLDWALRGNPDQVCKNCLRIAKTAVETADAA